MKLSFYKILIALLFFSLVVSMKNKLQMQNTQLFDLIEKNSQEKDKHTTEKNDNSLFNTNIINFHPITIEKNEKSNEINFHQTFEKKIEAKNSLNSASQNKVALKNQIKNKMYLKEIEKLKNKIDDLMSLNEKLGKRVQIHESKNGKKMNQNMMNFIQVYDDKVDEFKGKLKEDKNKIVKNMAKENESISEIFSETNQKFTEIKTTIKVLGDQIGDIQEKQFIKNEKIKNGLEVDNLTINNNLNVGGILFTKKLSTEQINLDNISIDSTKIKIDRDNKLQIGNQVLTFDKIINNLNYIMQLKEYCGEDFSACKIVNDENIQVENNKKENILKNLKKLRNEASLAMRRR